MHCKCARLRNIGSAPPDRHVVLTSGDVATLLSPGACCARKLSSRPPKRSTPHKTTAALAAAAHDRRRWLILGVVAIAQLMIMLDSAIMNIALPSAAKDLGHPAAGHLVGHHGLHARVRRPAAAGWSHRRLHRPQARLPHRPRRLRGGLRARRCRAVRVAAVRGPRPAGCVRRAARARVAGHHHRDLHLGSRPRQGVRRLRCDLRRWRCHRPDPRRHPHRVPRLALVPLRQPADRADRRHPRHPVRPGVQGSRRPAPGRPRRRALEPRPGHPRVRLHRGLQAAGRRHAARWAGATRPS